jgi:hypothetical protein
VCIKFRSKDYYAKLISHASASKLIAKLHYSQGTSNTSSFAFGLFSVKDNNLVGACLWMCAPCGVAKKFSNTFINDRPLMNTVLTLSRFVLCDNLPKNAASFFLSKCIKHIKKTGKYDCLVTYADQRVGHIGTIYKASKDTQERQKIKNTGLYTNLKEEKNRSVYFIRSIKTIDQPWHLQSLEKSELDLLRFLLVVDILLCVSMTAPMA